MLNLPARIQKIIDMCPNVDVVADIGTDHGLTACGLLLQEKATRVIATDISEPSLQKAKALSIKLALEKRMEFRIGDGLGTLRIGEAQGLVLSGMGAPLIIDILKAGEKTARAANYLLVCAHNYPERVRAFCQEKQYYIEAEAIVHENEHYYAIMRILPGKKNETYTETELLTGKSVAQSGTYLRYLQHQMKTCMQIKEQLAQASDSARYDEVEKILQLYEVAFRNASEGEST